MLTKEILKASPNEILQAWQDGKIGYRDAMGLLDVDSLPELYAACHSSCVEIRTALSPVETKMVEVIVGEISQ